VKDTKKSISLFSGAMGLDIGLQQAGIDIQIGQDFNKACVNTMFQNGHKAILGDICRIEPEELLSAAGLTFLSVVVHLVSLFRPPESVLASMIHVEAFFANMYE